MKILKIKIGEAWVNNKNVPVFATAFEKLSKDKKTKYYEVRQPVFVQEVQEKPQPVKPTEL